MEPTLIKSSCYIQQMGVLSNLEKIIDFHPFNNYIVKSDYTMCLAQTPLKLPTVLSIQFLQLLKNYNSLQLRYAACHNSRPEVLVLLVYGSN